RQTSQDKKRQKARKLASKSSAYQSILEEQLENAKKKNEAASAVEVSRKRPRPAPESDSDTDDYVVSASELKRARAEARHWRRRYEEVTREKAQLTNIIQTMSGTINGQLATLCTSLEPTAGPSARRTVPPSNPPRAPAISEMALPPRSLPRITPRTPPRTPPRNPPRTPSRTPPRCRPSLTNQPRSAFHLKSGITIGARQAKRALGQRKPALVAKDIAQALWGREGLADRTYGGKLAPKDYRKPDAILRKEMTPEKVALVIETVTHWGTKAGVPVADAIDNISTILSQKIQ
ncbi:unnamed protein product, partial [Ixodes pacificus]